MATGVAAHNAAIRDLHAARPSIGFVDMDRALPRGRAYFNDVSHLTTEGAERFVDLLMPAVLDQLGIRQP